MNSLFQLPSYEEFIDLFSDELGKNGEKAAFQHNPLFAKKIIELTTKLPLEKQVPARLIAGPLNANGRIELNNHTPARNILEPRLSIKKYFRVNSDLEIFQPPKSNKSQRFTQAAKDLIYKNLDFAEFRYFAEAQKLVVANPKQQIVISDEELTNSSRSSLVTKLTDQINKTLYNITPYENLNPESEVFLFVSPKIIQLLGELRNLSQMLQIEVIPHNGFVKITMSSDVEGKNESLDLSDVLAVLLTKRVITAFAFGLVLEHSPSTPAYPTPYLMSCLSSAFKVFEEFKNECIFFVKEKVKS